MIPKAKIPRDWHKHMLIYEFNRGGVFWERRIFYACNDDANEYLIYRNNIAVRFRVKTTWKRLWGRVLNYIDKNLAPSFKDSYYITYGWYDRG